MTQLLPVEEAVARIVAGIIPVDAEEVPLARADRRTLAAPLKALRTQPPFAASSMDGYALRAADVAAPPKTLRVIGMSAAGSRFAGTVGAGDAVRIFTGAPMPEGADAVLIQENAAANPDGTVTARQSVRPNQNLRHAGLDFQEGALLLDAGRELAMRELALAAAMGHASVAVRRRPRVAVIATGNELVAPGALAGPDQIYASSSPAIMALVRALGGEGHDLGIAADDVVAIAGLVERALALKADVIVTLGGASVGDHDLVQAALTGRGMKLGFWRIAMRPGKPLMFGEIGGTRIVGLPGNPVSSLVCAILFLAPLIGALLGQPPADPTEPAALGADLKANDTRQDYIRARLASRKDDTPSAIPLPVQDSSMLSTFAVADCLIVRPPHAPAATAGEPCTIIRLDRFR